MSISFYLERKSTSKENSAMIPLGSSTLNSFYPTMPFEVFEILVNENNFSIIDEYGKSYSIDSFKDSIRNTYTNSSLPLILLNS